MTPDLQATLRKLPDKPGVYLMRDARGDVVYVGKAQNLKHRVRSYWQKATAIGRIEGHRIRSVIDRVVDVEYTITDSVSEALLLEANLIKRYRPRFNVRLKDDKSYPYIKITKADDFPRVERTRKLVQDGSRYFGPYASASSVDESMNLVRRLFPFRTCTIDITEGERALARPCLLYHIKRCQGPCIQAVSKADYGEQIDPDRAVPRGPPGVGRPGADEGDAGRVGADRVRASGGRPRQDPGDRADDGEPEDGRVQADRARSRRPRPPGQPGRDPAVRDPQRGDGRARRVPARRLPRGARRGGPLELPRAVLRARDVGPAAGARAVRAAGRRRTSRRSWRCSAAGPVHLSVPQRGEKRELMVLATQNAAETLAREQARWLADQGKTLGALEELAEALGLPGPPLRIECYDISNVQGSDSVGSMVVFEEGRPRPGEYRRFKIRTVVGANDFASHQEVLRRRFRRARAGDEGAEEALRWAMPDLVIIDGGKGQVSAAKEVLDELGLHDLPMAGLAKEREELFLPGRLEPVVLPATSPALYLVQRLRDEAHRFAITYHRDLRSKRQTHSAFDDLPGRRPEAAAGAAPGLRLGEAGPGGPGRADRRGAGHRRGPRGTDQGDARELGAARGADRIARRHRDRQET